MASLVWLKAALSHTQPHRRLFLDLVPQTGHVLHRRPKSQHRDSGGPLGPYVFPVSSLTHWLRLLSLSTHLVQCQRHRADSPTVSESSIWTFMYIQRNGKSYTTELQNKTDTLVGSMISVLPEKGFPGCHWMSEILSRHSSN